MPTYRTTARTQLRSPSGAVGEAPDGPGAMATMLDDVDNYLGVGGAEYAANLTALQAIPAGRKFLGKLAYRADIDTVFRWVGLGNTAVGANAASNGWQAWSRPPTAFSPSYSGIGFTSPTTNVGLWGIAEGLIWLDTYTQNGPTTSTPSGTNDATLTAPDSLVSQMGEGGGTWATGGATSANAQSDLVVQAVGTAGTGITVLRIRARVASAAGASVKQNLLGASVTPGVGDWISVHFRGPSGRTA